MSRKPRRPGPPEDVAFPVTPMLDMAFQLLAFFILTFQAPSEETRIDLYLPAAPAALPGDPNGQANPPPTRRADLDLENNLVIHARADQGGGLWSLSLQGESVPDLKALGDRLRPYAESLQGEPLRVLVVADDRLRYEEAARLIGTCASAGVAAIRLADPSGGRAAPGVAP